MNIGHRFGVGFVATVAVAVSSAQALVCAVSDASCFQREHDKACLGLGATVASCSAWLRTLERSEAFEHPNVRLSAAETNLVLNDLIGGRGSKTEHLDRAEEILDELIIVDPTNIKALFGLAALRETKEERVDLLRRVVAVDPTFILGWESLALAVSRGGAKEDLQESAEILEQAYVASPPGAKKWHLAADAIMQFENAQSSTDAERLRSRARNDYGVDALMVVAAQPEATGPERVEAALDELCSTTGVVIFGAKSCVEAIQHVVDAANTQTAGPRALYAESATAAMWTAAQSGGRLDSVDPAWRDRFETAIDGFLKSQRATPDMYAAYAAITPDRGRRVRAMEVAAERFPSNGDVLMRLGLAYMDQGRDEDAVDALTRAKELLPPAKHVMIDQALKAAWAQ